MLDLSLYVNCLAAIATWNVVIGGVAGIVYKMKKK